MSNIKVYFDTNYCWKLKIYCWIHCNKIIFKGVDSVVRPNFKVIFAIFHTCRSREQCTGPREKRKRLLRLLSKLTLSVCLAKIIFANLFYYSAYFCYYLWVSLHFLVLFMYLIVLFQLIFTFIYSIFSKKFSILTK